MRRQIELELAKAYHLSGRGPPPPQEGIRAGQQFSELERFGHIVVGAQIQTQDDILLLTLRGEHDDRHVQPAAAHHTADLVAIDLGQHDIQQDQIGLSVHRQRKAPFAVGGTQHRETEVLERVLQSEQQSHLVFDDENPADAHAAASTAEELGGSDTVKVLPAPVRLATDTVPWWAWTMNSTMLKPNPTPPACRASLRST